MKRGRKRGRKKVGKMETSTTATSSVTTAVKSVLVPVLVRLRLPYRDEQAGGGGEGGGGGAAHLADEKEKEDNAGQQEATRGQEERQVHVEGGGEEQEEEQEEEEEGAQEVERDGDETQGDGRGRMRSRSGRIVWTEEPSSCRLQRDDLRLCRRQVPRSELSSSAAADTTSPGPTAAARAAVADTMTSAFLAFFPAHLEEEVVAMTCLEANTRERPIDGWRRMGIAEFRAYVGLLILAGVYRSRGEACQSLWHPQSGRSIFRTTMPLKTFRAYSTALRFDDRSTRQVRRSAFCSSSSSSSYNTTSTTIIATTTITATSITTTAATSTTNTSSSSSSSSWDKLAPIRHVWDTWSERLPLLYKPGSDVTVDERLVPFKGRCPFKQYMPNKPTKYGIKLWVACDAQSSYAWKMRVYTGKPNKRSPPEKNLSSRVVLDLTEGLGPGRNVTFDNFFTSYELARILFCDRGLTALGTLRRNRAEIPDELLVVRGREVKSSRFAFAAEPDTPAAALVSYLAKPNKNVLLLTTLQPYASAPELSDRADCKPLAVLHYNSTKGGVDNLDKVLGTYSCRRRTLRWPMALFHNMVDVSAYNAFVLWRELNPTWMLGKRNRRRLFLEQLGKELTDSLRQERGLGGVGGGDDGHDGNDDGRGTGAGGGGGGGRRQTGVREGDELVTTPLIESSSLYRRRVREDIDDEEEEEEEEEDDHDGHKDDLGPPASKKRKRCRVCPRSRDAKTRKICAGCRVHVCSKCSRVYCPRCRPRTTPADPVLQPSGVE